MEFTAQEMKAILEGFLRDSTHFFASRTTHETRLNFVDNWMEKKLTTENIKDWMAKYEWMDQCKKNIARKK